MKLTFGRYLEGLGVMMITTSRCSYYKEISLIYTFWVHMLTYDKVLLIFRIVFKQTGLLLLSARLFVFVPCCRKNCKMCCLIYNTVIAVQSNYYWRQPPYSTIRRKSWNPPPFWHSWRYSKKSKGLRACRDYPTTRKSPLDSNRGRLCPNRGLFVKQENFSPCCGVDHAGNLIWRRRLRRVP